MPKTRFHVDLGDPPAEELPPPPPGKLGWARSFKKFKSLKKAVRWAKAERDAGRWDTMPEILDDNGDQITIDWDSPMWLTHHELEERLNTAELSRQQHRKTVERLHEEQAARDNQLIAAGYIPISALAPHLVDMTVRHDGGNGLGSMFSRLDFGPTPTETTYTLELRQFGYRIGKEPHPFISAMSKLAESRKP